MPEHELDLTAQSGLPGETGADDLQDDDLRQEIELVADLVVAASASDGPLTTAEIDRILGVRRV